MKLNVNADVRIVDLQAAFDVTILFPSLSQNAGAPMRSTMLLRYLVAIAPLFGCVTVNDTYLADGSIAHKISCNGRELSIETCFEKAAELCGASGFETVTREGKSTGRTIAKGSTDLNSGAFETRNILVRCNDQKPVPRYD